MTGRGDSASALGAERFRFENWVAELGPLDLNLEGGPCACHHKGNSSARGDSNVSIGESRRVAE
jgi:hypothetical protein